MYLSTLVIIAQRSKHLIGKRVVKIYTSSQNYHLNPFTNHSTIYCSVPPYLFYRLMIRMVITFLRLLMQRKSYYSVHGPGGALQAKRLPIHGNGFNAILLQQRTYPGYFDGYNLVFITSTIPFFQLKKSPSTICFLACFTTHK